MDMFGASPLIAGGVDMTRPQATLLVYSQRIYDTNVLRPYIYDFSDKVVNKLMGAEDSLTKAFARPDIASDEDVAKCVKPAFEGTAINMDTYNAGWTFVLIVSQPEQYDALGMRATGSKVSIFSGNCIGEPINPFTMYSSTPTPNPECALIIQSRQIMSTGVNSGNAFGAFPKTVVQRNDDIIDPCLNMARMSNIPGLHTAPELYLMTPYNTLKNTEGGTMNGDTTVSTAGECLLCNANRKPVQAAIKTPGVHVKQIFEGLDNQVNEAPLSDIAPSGLAGIGVMSGVDDIESFRQGFEHKLSWMDCDGRVQTDGINVEGVTTIRDLMMVFGNNLKLQPFKIAPNSQYRDPQTGAPVDVLPQTNVSPKVMYSGFIASAVSSIATDCGLSSIGFGYCSWSPETNNNLDKHRFQVVEMGTCLACPPPDATMAANQLKAAVMMFRKLFNENVAPFVIGSLGHFEVYVTYSNTSETMVDLKIMDNNVGSNYGVYEAPNRLSMLSTTVVGTENQFISNGQALHNLATLVQGRTSANAMGLTAFGGVEQINMTPPVGFADARNQVAAELPAF